MISGIFGKDSTSPTGGFVYTSDQLRPDAPPPSVLSSPMVTNVNLDSIIQTHRRKILRRAANRRSAQLSRARKKAHLEDLKTENTRLQRILDVLDSQPEVVFCCTPTGKITYISENSMHFIKLRTNGNDHDEDPTHINQFLLPESVHDIQHIIRELQAFTVSSMEDQDVHNLFMSKEVFFHDNCGQKVSGALRCSKVHRRASLSDIAGSDGGQFTTGATGAAPSSSNNNYHLHQSTGSSSNSGNSIPPPNKRQKNNKAAGSKTHANEVPENFFPSDNIASLSRAPSNNATDQWTHLSILADCVTSLSTENEQLKSHGNFIQDEGSKVVSDLTFYEQQLSTDTHKPSKNTMEEEFVCNIRIAEHAFLPYSTSSSSPSSGNCDAAVFMFTSAFLLNQSVPASSIHHNRSKDTLLIHNDSGRSSSATTNATNTSSNNSSDTSSEDNNIMN